MGKSCLFFFYFLFTTNFIKSNENHEIFVSNNTTIRTEIEKSDVMNITIQELSFIIHNSKNATDLTNEMNQNNYTNSTHYNESSRLINDIILESDELKNKTINFQEELNKSDVKNSKEDSINEKKEFNLTREIEKLYINSFNSTDLKQEEYVDDHDELYFKNIEEINNSNLDESENEKEEEKKLLKEWEVQVHDFSAHDLLNIEVNASKKFKFYEQIEIIPSSIKIAYYVNAELKKISFKIISPDNKEIFYEPQKSHGYFQFYAIKKGIYKFILENKKNVEPLRITFGLHSGENLDMNLKNEHLDVFNKKIENVGEKLKELKNSQNIIIKRYDGHHHLILLHNYRITVYSLLETFAMGVILLFQLFYIKNLIKDFWK